MSHNIKLKKGFDINLAGKAKKTIAECDQPETFALKPTDFLGIKRPKVMVSEGDSVKAKGKLYISDDFSVFRKCNIKNSSKNKYLFWFT